MPVDLKNVRSRVLAAFTSADLPIFSFWVGTALVFALSVVNFDTLPVHRFLDGGEIERLYRTVARSAWQHLWDPGDYHHPGLWFALVRWPFLATHYSLAAVGVFGEACALVAIAAGGLLAYELGGRLVSLAAMALLASLPLLSSQALEVSDVPLFVALALLTILAYVKVSRGGGAGWRVALAVVFGLSFHASYAAIPLLGAFILDLIFRRENRRQLIIGLAAGSLIGVQRIWHVVSLIPGELHERQRSAHFGFADWSNLPFGDFLNHAFTSYFSESYLFVIALALFAASLAPLRLYRRQTPMLFAILTAAIFLLLQPIVRVKEYYAILFPIGFVVTLATFLAPSLPDERAWLALARRAMAATACVASIVFFVQVTLNNSMFMTERERDDVPRRVVQALIRDGATSIYYDQDWQDTSLYFFKEPFVTMEKCFRGILDCADHTTDTLLYPEASSGRRVIELARNTLDEQWETESTDRVQKLQARSVVHVFLSTGKPNGKLFPYLRSHCRQLAQADQFEAWRCPQL